MSPNANTPRCLIRGSINVDEFFQVASIAHPGQTISSHALTRRPGGKGANQAAAVTKAGGIVDLVGAVGQDGVWVKERLAEGGICVDGVSIVEEPTGRAIIQVAEDGENSIILFKGANYTIIPPSSAFISLHHNTTYLLLQNEVPLSDTTAYLTYASALPGGGKRMSTVFNPSPMPSDEEVESFPWDLLTWLVVNEGELDSLYKVLKLSRTPSRPMSRTDTRPQDIPSAASSSCTTLELLLELVPKTNIVCTLGSTGVLATFKGSLGQELLYLPAAKLQTPGGIPKDTTGAGDCFTGYMVAGLMELDELDSLAEKTWKREDLEKVMARCVQAAGLCVEVEGSMDSIPAGTDVDARLVAYKELR